MSLILVIEEQQDASGLIKRILMTLGHTTVCVGTTSEADSWLKHNKPDLTIVGAGRHGELASERLAVLEGHGVDASRVLLGARGDAKEYVRQRFGTRVREVFDTPQGLHQLEALVKRALEEVS